MNRWPKISFIIPAREVGDAKPALKAIKRVDYPQNKIEVLLAEGRNPSRQRNLAVQKAKGELVYFLDNDSQPDKQSLKRAVAVFQGERTRYHHPRGRGFSLLPAFLSRLLGQLFFTGQIYRGEVGVVGGPSGWFGSETFWQGVSGSVFESFFAYFKMVSRFRPVGEPRRCTEKELVLCNMVAQREIFIKVGGLNESLYPNEENEFLNRVDRDGYQLIYHPGVVVQRPQRSSLGEILQTFFRYGRGRMEQVKTEGLMANLLYLAPLGLGLVVLALPWFKGLGSLLMLVYFVLGAWSATGYALRRGRPYLILIVLPVIFFSHLAYAGGLSYGIFTNLHPQRLEVRKKKVVVRRLKSFAGDWYSI